jgi:hypothetical protein
MSMIYPPEAQPIVGTASAETGLAAGAALKEWAVAVKLLAEGRQVVVVRKGGIREKRFQVARDRFFLYPTYFHPSPDLLQPAYHADLAAVLSERPPEDRVRISTFAEVDRVLTVERTEQLQALAPHYCWTPEYVDERFRWRARYPLLVLVLRAYRLAQPVELPQRPEYGGCTSWIDVVDPVDLSSAIPALADAEFQQRSAAIQALLTDPA